MGDVTKLRPFAPISPTKWHGKEPPPREWMIEGMAVRKTTCLFSGVGGLGKTLLCQQLMSACATGSTWLGRQVPVCRSLALFAEDPEDEVWRRQMGIGRHYDIDPGDLDDVDMLTLDDVDNPTLWVSTARDPAGHPTPLWLDIVAFMRERGHQLLILDNVNAIFGGNANFPEHVRPFLQVLNQTARDINGLVLLVQHPSSAGEQDGYSQAGARTWRNTVRAQIIMGTPKEETEEEPSDERLIRAGKNNYGRRAAPIRVRWDEGVFVPVLVSDQRGGRLTQFAAAELRAKICIAMRDMIAKGNRFSLAEKARNNVGAVLKQCGGDWNGYTGREIRDSVGGMLSNGQIVTVTIGTGQRAVVLARPEGCTYPGEVLPPPTLL